MNKIDRYWVIIVLSVLGIVAAVAYRVKIGRECAARGGQMWCSNDPPQCICLSQGITR